MKSTVLVLGGGVAGMSTAHELMQRGFDVTVLEATDTPGGKARSVRVSGTGTGGRADLPAEHGFRFFPGFYRHLPDTMRHIPYGGQPQGVLDNLRVAPRCEIANEGTTSLNLNHFPSSMADLFLAVSNTVRTITEACSGDPSQLSLGDLLHFGVRLLTLLASCEERRYAEWEEMSWWEFSGANKRDTPYQEQLADGLTRTLVAARARQMSARTGGYILLQLLAYSNTPGRQSDRVLCGPTNDVWINPWLEHLGRHGVDFQFERRATTLCVENGRITAVEVDGPDGSSLMTADWYVAAVPVEHMVPLASKDVTDADPGLARLSKLTTRWMNGIVFYLRSDFRPVQGHIICIGSPWSLTAVSQRQFWSGVDFERMGNGQVGGILSVDISEWETPGLLTNKPAKQCNAEEIASEVLFQLRAALGTQGVIALSDKNIESYHIDQDIRFPSLRAAADGVTTDVNLEPLLVNVAGSWHDRPTAVTQIENLFLASDYVRTYTDLATMEGANEAARRAVNGILRASGSSEPPCELWPLKNSLIWAPARFFDRLRFYLSGDAARPRM
jgi:uncharacterized protein with NAD-binding domain and iron-sulfur cluster